MKIIKRSDRKDPIVSLVLLDWGVRESFHIARYLRNQTVDRSLFEVSVIEYYSTPSKYLSDFIDDIDLYLLMQTPPSFTHSKHHMYNVGLLATRGKIVVFCDSDAMVKPTFIESIIKAFEGDQKVIFHIDQFRNMERKYFPFNYPTFEEVVGSGCINYRDGMTTGVADPIDQLHTKNYGSCMCALRSDIMAIGGACQHYSYIGHICGPYDMTFRLANIGRREVWSTTEFMYHTWHPGEGGTGGHYIGPNKGYVATTAMEPLMSGRIMPLAENAEVRKLRLAGRDQLDEGEYEAALEAACRLDPLFDKRFVPVLAANLQPWHGVEAVATQLPPSVAPFDGAYFDGRIGPWEVFRLPDRYVAREVVGPADGPRPTLEALDYPGICRKIHAVLPLGLRLRRKLVLLAMVMAGGLALRERQVREVVQRQRSWRTMLAIFKVGLSGSLEHRARTKYGFIMRALDIAYLMLANRGKLEGPVWVLTQHPHDGALLRGVVRLGLAPGAKVRQLNSIDQAHRVLAEVEKRAGTVIVHNAVYLRFYNAFCDFKPRQLLLA